MKKFFIAIMGGTVVLTGVAMLVLPGPGLLVIAGGLAILATEFIWARRALRKAKGVVAKVRRGIGFRRLASKAQDLRSEPMSKCVGKCRAAIRSVAS